MMSTNSGRIVTEYSCSFYWLCELLRLDGASTGRYAAAKDGCPPTADWNAARKMTKDEAEALAPTLFAPEGYEWRALEHGFCG